MLELNINSSSKILINGLSARTGGGVRYLNNLLKSVPDNFNITLLINKESNKFFRDIDKRVLVIDFKISNIFIRLFIEQFWIPIYTYKNNYNLLFSPADTASIFTKTKQIMGVQNPNPYYDLNVKYKLTSRFKNYIQKIIASISSKVVDGIIFVSNSINIEFDRNVKFYGKTKVIYHGLDSLSIDEEGDTKNNL